MDAGTTASSGCVRDPALIASAPSCRIDDYCPCGTHCSLGICVATCEADEQCTGGQVCDDFGRCRAPGSDGRIAPIQESAQANLRVTPGLIQVFERDEPYYVRIRPDGSGGAARVVAKGSVRLLCNDGEAPATSCAFEDVPAPGLEVGVVYTGPLGAAADEDLSPSVVIYDASGGSLTVALEPTAALAAPAIDGQYDGFAWFEAPGATRASRVDTPIRAEVYDANGRATVALHDITGAILPSSPMVLELTKVSGSTVTATLPRFIRFASTSADADTAEVYVERTNGRGRLGEGALQLRFDVQVFGLDLPGTGTARRLIVAATRTADRAEGPTPPPLTVDETPSSMPGRGLVASPRLEAALTAIAQNGPLYPRVEDRLPFSETPDEDASLIGCLASEDQLVEATFAEYRAWNRACGLWTSMPIPSDFTVIGQAQCTPPGTTTEGITLCGLQFAGYSLSGPGPLPNVPTLDVCDAMAAQEGCTIEPYTPTETSLVLETTVGTTVWHAAYIVVRQCRFVENYVSPAPAKCVQTLACFDPATLGDTSATGTLSTASGEPGCAPNNPPLTFGSLEQPSVEPAVLLAQCEQDITRAVPASPLGAQFGSAGCVDRGRFLLRLEHAIDGFRDGTVAPVQQRDAHRLVQQWLQVHGLVARLAHNQMQQDLALAASGDPSTAAAQALEASLTVWDTTLQPWVAGSLLSMSEEVLSNPDPRPELGYDTAGLPGAAKIGVSVDLLEAAAQQLELADALLNRAWFEGAPSKEQARLQTASAALRVATEAGLLAEQLYLRAGGDTVPWQAGWQRAQPRFRLAIDRLVNRIELLKSDVNPIGIDDSDLPLYVRDAPTSASERFAASTRFLVGNGPAVMSPAWQAVDRARQALDDARASFQERRQVSDQVEQRIQDIRFRYGELITGYCGASLDNPTNYANATQPACLNPSSDSVLDCAAIDTEVCFVEERCRARGDDFLESTTSAQLGYDLCIAYELRSLYGSDLIGASASLQTVLTQLAEDITNATSQKTAFPFRITSLDRAGANGRSATLQSSGGDVIVPLDALGGLDVQVPESARRAPGGDPATSLPLLTRLAAKCDVPRQKMLRTRPASAPSTCSLPDECPRTQVCRAAACVSRAASDPLDGVECYYDGAISEQAIAVRAAAQDIAIARAELDEFSERYDVVKRSCLLLKAGQTMLESETTRHNAVMKDLSVARAAATSVEAYAASAKDCSNSLGAAAGAPNPFTVGSAGVACGAGAVEAGAKIAGAVVDHKVGEAERKHEATMQRIQNQTDLAICFNDAEIELVGAKAAALRISRAQKDQAIAVLNLRGQKSYTQALFAEGNAAIAMERARLERSLPSEFILSEAAELYANRMNYAQRISYLAVRAAEYEFQASLGARQTVLGAGNPNDLETALRTVTAFLDNGRVAGASPTSLLAVISLREHLLQLGDRSGDPNGQLGLTEIERFQRLLTSSRYATYGDDGAYLGQRIPFSIHPLGTLGLGNSQGVPIVADNDCAERLWSVNAAVLGQDVYEGSESSITRLDLLKRNTFYSQWCSAPSGADEFQVATVRPEVNLLLDPADPNRQPVASGAITGESRGRMQPYLNVDRAEFEKAEYEQGSTDELAGRGLYGDYALFIPRSVLNLEGRPGLRLDRIEDILLRLDYVSVARD